MVYSFDDFQVDTVAFEIRQRGQRLAVEPQVLDVLIALIENRDRVVTRRDLLDRIWKDRVVSDAALSSRIKSVRQLLGDDGARQRYVRTIHGRGFRFVGNATGSADGVAGAAASPPATPSEVVDGATGRPTPGPEAHPETRYAKSGDVHVAYQVFGTGPVNLVLAPGFVSHIDNYWDEPRVAGWLNRLGGFARVAMFDKRGTGLSDQVPDLPGMDERMDDVRAVMDAAGFDQAAIMGISEGGSLAALFAATHPARCRALVLYGAFARFNSWFPTRESLQELFDYIETDWGSGKSLPRFAPTMGDDPAFRVWWGKFERLGATPGAAIALMRMNSEIDLSDILATIQVPALVIHRADDVLIDVAGGRVLAGRIPGARYVELAGTDHLPWAGTNALEITDIARDFLVGTPPFDPGDRVLATVLAIQLETAGAGGQDHRLQGGEREKVGACVGRFRGGELIPNDRGYLATFDGPARALRCARAIVEALGAARIGVHTGEVQLAPGAVHGLAVRMASDIADRAEPAQVLVSRTVTDLVAGSGIAFIDAGTHRIPGAPDDWRLFRVAG
jgi:pimeloyl-ACP methyl ester carboxylesterase/DNA-binding winged helix-turn-helix (wHTH) protein